MKFVMILCIFSLYGCASQRQLHIYTNPTGGMLFEQGSGRQFQAPVSLSYKLEDKLIPGFEAVWVDGARTSTPSKISLCGTLHCQITIDRNLKTPSSAYPQQNLDNSHKPSTLLINTFGYLFNGLLLVRSIFFFL